MRHLRLAAAPLAAQKGPVRRRTVAEDLTLFRQVLDHLRVNHPDSLDAHRLIRAAVPGMVQAADPHSYVVTGYRLDPVKEKLRADGKLVPVPVSFAYVGGTEEVQLPVQRVGALLERQLVLRLAGTKWGAAGYYRVAALLDPEVVAARGAFDRAQAILQAGGQ